MFVYIRRASTCTASLDWLSMVFGGRVNVNNGVACINIEREFKFHFKDKSIHMNNVSKSIKEMVKSCRLLGTKSVFVCTSFDTTPEKQ